LSAGLPEAEQLDKGILDNVLRGVRIVQYAGGIPQ
jgi:hypothetical protein